MSFEYIDAGGDTLDVLAWGDGVRLEQSALVVDIIPEDAPAVALAILEAAGCADGLGEYDPGEMRAPVHVAVERLRMVRDEARKRAERDAEDAKVVEFHTAIGANLNRIERHHRDLYNAARKFFQEA